MARARPLPRGALASVAKQLIKRLKRGRLPSRDLAAARRELGRDLIMMRGQEPVDVGVGLVDLGTAGMGDFGGHFGRLTRFCRRSSNRNRPHPLALP